MIVGKPKPIANRPLFEYKDFTQAIRFSLIGFVLVAFICWIGPYIVDHFPYPEKVVIDNVYTDFHLALGRQDYETAYTHMSPNYRQVYSIEDFIDTDIVFTGTVPLHANHCLRVTSDKATLYPKDCGFWSFWGGYGYELVKVDQQWYIDKYVWYID